MRFHFPPFLWEFLSWDEFLLGQQWFSQPPSINPLTGVIRSPQWDMWESFNLFQSFHSYKRLSYIILQFSSCSVRPVFLSWETWNPAVSSVWETQINKEENAEWSVPAGVIRSSLGFSVLPKVSLNKWIPGPKVRGLYDWRHSHPSETVLSASIRWQPATLLIFLPPAVLLWADSQSLGLKLYDSHCLTEKWDLSCHFIRIDNGEKKKRRLWGEKKESPCHLLISD